MRVMFYLINYSQNIWGKLRSYSKQWLEKLGIKYYKIVDSLLEVISKEKIKQNIYTTIFR